MKRNKAMCVKLILWYTKFASSGSGFGVFRAPLATAEVWLRVSYTED